MKTIPLDDSNLEPAIGLITRLNQNQAHNIGYLGESEEEVAADVKAIQPPEGYGFIAVSDDGQLHGLFGVEIDIELGRSWLFGPFVDHDAWDATADLLYDAILAALPPEISDQEIYCPNQNARVQRFALRHGFTFYSDGAFLTLDVRQRSLLSSSSKLELDDKHTAQFIALHANLFPNTYYSGEQLVKLAKDGDKHLSVHQVNGKLVGYLFIQVREASREGYIDFIGVDEGFRRQGIGQNLVASGLNWALQFPYVERIILTVKPDNIPAMRMYQNLGFKTEKVSRAYRKHT